MFAIYALGLTSFLLCMLLTPACRALAVRLHLFDKPDTKRKLHARPIPRLGGVPIVLSYIGALLLVLLLTPATQRLHIRHHDVLWALMPAAAIIFFTGLIDDLLSLKPWQKLLGQVAGASFAVSLGVRLSLGAPHGAGYSHFLGSPFLTIPVSIFWLLCCTNALNLIDGLDGLASGVGLFASVATLLVGILTGNSGLVLATMPLVGCLLAFLYYNFNPASIFLGDCGSLTIGFLLGCFSLVWGHQGDSLLGMVGPLMALALPLLDVGLAVLRRTFRRVPIFQGDRGHIHHVILDRGFKPGQAALILYGVCTVAASLALLQSFGHRALHIVVIVTFVALIWAGINYLDYVEFDAARRTMFSKRTLRHVRDEIYLQELSRSLRKADGPTACWTIVMRVCKDMHFDTAEMQIERELFTSHPDSDVTGFAWKITLPIGDSGRLTLCRREWAKPPKLMMVVLDRLQEHLTEKSVVLSPAPVAIRTRARGAGLGKQRNTSEAM